MHLALFRLGLILGMVTVTLSCRPPDSVGSPPHVKTGLDVLIEQNFEDLDGLRVGLITNPTGVDRNLVSIVDIFHEAPEVNLVALYGPEHGVRGDYDAGAYVESYTDTKTGVPVYSLYGQTRKPSPEMLEDIDVLVFDIQDIGVRSYTYISTMGLAMEAAAEKGLRFIVLDRPNPLGGLRVEGSVADEGFYSFVSPYPIPYVHGLTIGELALMINDQGWLKGGIQVDLSVIQMENWHRHMLFSETGHHWIPTSPHIPRHDSPFFYAMTGMFGELHILSEGVGYTLPFELFGAEWIDSDALASKMNRYNLPGVTFRPVSWRPYYGRDKETRLEGVHIHVTDPSSIRLLETGFRLVEAHHRLYPDNNPFDLAEDARIRMFDLVAGSSRIRETFTHAMSYEQLHDLFEQNAQSFRDTSRSYWLYD